MPLLQKAQIIVGFLANAFNFGIEEIQSVGLYCCCSRFIFFVVHSVMLLLFSEIVFVKVIILYHQIGLIVQRVTQPEAVWDVA